MSLRQIDPANWANAIGKRVLIQTTTGGCYHKKVGRIVSVLDGQMNQLNGSNVTANPAWLRVKFDEPADNSGQAVDADIFQFSELRLVE